LILLYELLKGKDKSILIVPGMGSV